MVLSKGVGMINHPQKYLKMFLSLLEVILSRKQKKSFLGGEVPSWHMIKNRAQRKMTNIDRISEIMRVAH